MSREIPQAVRAVVGLTATVIDDVVALPRTLTGLPVRVIGLAMQATMRLQQHYSGLVARGDEVLTGLRGEAEPGMATFDEDLLESAPGRSSAFDRAPGFDRDTPFDRASSPVDEDEMADEVAALIDDELSGLPADPAPEEVVEALADITDGVAAAGLDLDRAEPGLSTEDALETALLEADGAPDSALVDGATADASVVDTDQIAESSTPAPASLLEAEATEFDVAGSGSGGAGSDATQAAAPSDPGGSPVGEVSGAPEVSTDVDVLTPDGGIATVSGTVTDEGIAAPEDDAGGSGAADSAAAGSGAADAMVATDEGGGQVAAATGVRTDVDASATGGGEAQDTAGAQAAGSAPIEGYDGFTIAQLRGRLRGYQLATVQDLVAYEEATLAREPYLTMLRNRLEKLERQAVENSPLAPRGA